MTKRCPKGAKRNKKTGQCDPKVVRLPIPVPSPLPSPVPSPPIIYIHIK